MKLRRKIVIAVLIVLTLVLVIWVIWANTALMITEITVIDDRIPDAFDGYRIAHISDLHNAEFGENNQKLAEMLKSTEPDIILITGDVIDSNKTDIEIAVAFAEMAVEIAPTYYVTGNHEANVTKEEYDKLVGEFELAGVNILLNEAEILEINGEKIRLCGVNDPFYPGDFQSVLYDLTDDDMYTILMSHRPELFDMYVESGAELVFSGHAHGGQFRIPFIGGVAAPGQGLFPEYDAGLYAEDGTSMIVSRGLGNSIIPLRINNRPEIVLVVLECN